MSGQHGKYAAQTILAALSFSVLVACGAEQSSPPPVARPARTGPATAQSTPASAPDARPGPRRAAEAVPISPDGTAGSAGEGDRSAISIYLHGGVAEVFVIDPRGRRAGLDAQSGRSYGEIPRASVDLSAIGNDEEDAEAVASDSEGDPPVREIILLRPEAGTYTLTVVGLEDGRYDLGLGTVAADASSSGDRKVEGVSITRGAVHRYRFAFDPGPQPRSIDLTRMR